MMTQCWLGDFRRDPNLRRELLEALPLTQRGRQGKAIAASAQNIAALTDIELAQRIGKCDPAAARLTTLLVFDTVVLDPAKAPPILYTLHTPPGAIGRIAKDSGVHALLLAHLPPTIDDNRAEVEAPIRSSFSGKISFAEDKAQLEP